MTTSHCIETLAAYPQHDTLFAAFELGKAKWKLVVAGPGGRWSRHTPQGGHPGGGKRRAAGPAGRSTGEHNPAPRGRMSQPHRPGCKGPAWPAVRALVPG